MKDQYQELLDYWFDKSSNLPTKEEMRKWFLKSRLYDNIITEKFSEFYHSERLNPFPLTNAYNPISKEEILSRIILFDQIPRHLFRNSYRQFEFGEILPEYVLRNIGTLSHFTPKEALFFLMPLQHSENLDFQECFQQFWLNYENNHPMNRYRDYISFFAKIHKHSLNHLNLIKEFGRFPKRNWLLNRKNTSEEEEYLGRKERGFY